MEIGNSGGTCRTRTRPRFRHPWMDPFASWRLGERIPLFKIFVTQPLVLRRARSERPLSQEDLPHAKPPSRKGTIRSNQGSGVSNLCRELCRSSSLSRSLSKPRSPIAATGPSGTFITPYYSRLFRTKRSTLNVKRLTLNVPSATDFTTPPHHLRTAPPCTPKSPPAGDAGRHTAATIDDLDFIDGAKRRVGRLAGAQRPKAAHRASSAGRAPKCTVGSVNPSFTAPTRPFRVLGSQHRVKE
jgi:hypothetical protein